jgi:histidine triad (HIT) family protein
MTCPFCKLQRSLPPQVFYEDEHVFVMLDRQGLVFGHCMVIPRKHVVRIYEMDGDDYDYLMAIARKLSRVMHERLAPKAVAYVAHGAGLPHVHLHLVPLTEHDEISDPKKHMRHLSDAQLADEAARLRRVLPTDLEAILRSELPAERVR